jgi:protein tyrosine phosphatase
MVHMGQMALQRALAAVREASETAESTFYALKQTQEAPNCKVAVMARNNPKNRYCNVLPYDENRIILTGEHDYINASYLTRRTGENPAWHYIATQL